MKAGVFLTAVLGLLFILLSGVAWADAGPHGGYAATTDACATCHRTHTAPGPRLLNADAADNSFCYTCHNGTGAPAAPVVSTHANVNYANSAEAAFSLACTQCHDPHGNASALAIIKEYVQVRAGASPTTSGPVIFTAREGINSFDDGVSSPSSRLCVTCHENVNNPGFPMSNHVGGANHVGGDDFTGMDCVTCHPHSLDGDLYTEDGFMPEGLCIGCHDVAQDNGDGVPVNGRRPVVGEFANASHHVAGNVQDEDCTTCHFTGNHQAGRVELNDVDNPGSVITLNDDPRTNSAEAAKLEPFCLACHDEDGAGGQPPFSGGVAPPVVDNVLWTAAAHKIVSNLTCFDCHDNGHGSNKISLLAPWNAAPDGSPADPLQEEERFCYQCHDGSSAAVNVQAQFNQTSRHNVSADDPQGGQFVECVNCHNPHANNNSNKISDPNNTRLLWMGNNTGFCLTCHDGQPPAGVTFPANAPGTGYDKSAYVNSSHDNLLGSYGCSHCHNPHGAPYNALLPEAYATNDYNPYNTADYQLCWRCHVENEITMQRNAFDQRHNLHVRRENSSCIACHDAHAPFDSGEQGLINFEFAAQRGFDFQYIDGYNASTAYWFDTGQNEGACYLGCHAENHTPETYRPRDNANTEDCTACHPGGPPPP